MQFILHTRIQALRQLGKGAGRAPNNLRATRTYGDIPKTEKTGSVNSNNSSTRNMIPTIAIGVLITAIPSYYFLHTNKAPASGQAEIQEARRKGDPSNEYRDPRDSGVKTLEDKKRKQGN